MQLREGDVSEVLGELVAGLDDIAGTIRIGRVDGHLGAKPGVLSDVRVPGNPCLDVGHQHAGKLPDSVEQLVPAPPPEGAPVDEMADLGHGRRGRASSSR